jgi:hypothetical protein
MSDIAFKAGLFFVWPFIVLLVLFMGGIVLVWAWVAIPFAQVKRKPDGGIDLRFRKDEE